MDQNKSSLASLELVSLNFINFWDVSTKHIKLIEVIMTTHNSYFIIRIEEDKPTTLRLVIVP